MALHAQAAGFVAAHDDRLTFHERADVAKAAGVSRTATPKSRATASTWWLVSTVRTTEPVQPRFFFR